MYYGQIMLADVANGPGIRLSLFVSGCKNHCKGCFQPQTWDFNYGKPFTNGTMDMIFSELQKPYYDGITILGGDPMELENQGSVSVLISKLRAMWDAEGSHKTIWMYTGYHYEDLLPGGKRYCAPFTDRILSSLDVLVDGPFEEKKKDISLQWRGSSNQRVIDIPASQKCGRVVCVSDV